MQTPVKPDKKNPMRRQRSRFKELDDFNDDAAITYTYLRNPRNSRVEATRFHLVVTLNSTHG